MRRKDREITDVEEIIKIMDACEVVRLGIADGDYPYIVPVNFAYEASGGQIMLYIHGAMAGRKYDLLRRHPVCSFEMDIPQGIACNDETGSVTMHYQSIMGKADVAFLEGGEKQAAMDEKIMARYQKTKDFAYNRQVLQATAVARLTVTEITAKNNQ